MDSAVQSDELLEFFKALADANRLKIVGLLAGQEYSVEQLAEMLALSPSTVSHHLSRLGDVGLVSARAESYYNLYSLQTDALEAKARRLLSREGLEQAAASVDLDAYDQKVLKNTLDAEGRIKQLPSQFKKFKVVVRYVLDAFEVDRRYSEKEVNAIIARYHADTAAIRREMVEQGWMARAADGGTYWRVAE